MRAIVRAHAGLVVAVCASLWACSRSKPVPDVPEASSPVQASMPARSGTKAVIGKPAPDFELPDLEGHKVRLSQFRGHVVVLEWFNPECPFVKASHTKGSLRGLSDKYTGKGVVWLAINSAASGKQGYGVEANAAGKRKYALNHPVLIDESGDVGHLYDAQHTPHMFVVDEKGVLVYRGAIDNSPDGEGESPQGGKLVNYVETALTELGAGRPVTTAETEAYGCTVKYTTR
jgi:peroxiredoxin